MLQLSVKGPAGVRMSRSMSLRHIWATARQLQLSLRGIRKYKELFQGSCAASMSANLSIAKQQRMEMNCESNSFACSLSLRILLCLTEMLLQCYGRPCQV